MDVAARIDRLSATQAALLDALLQEALDDHPGTGDPRPGPRVAVIRDGSGATPLFVVHGAGGRTMFLNAFVRGMSASQPIFGIEAGNGAPDADICLRYLEAITSVQPRGPYRLGGYSAGCLIAFELAALLEAAGERVEFLLFLDPVAPPRPASAPKVGAAARLRRRFELAALAGVTPLSPEFAYIEAVGRQLAAVATAFKAAPVRARIHAIRATLGPYAATPASLDAWAQLAHGGLEQRAIEADHLGIVAPPHAEAVAAIVKAWLDTLPS